MEKARAESEVLQGAENAMRTLVERLRGAQRTSLAQERERLAPDLEEARAGLKSLKDQHHGAPPKEERRIFAERIQVLEQATARNRRDTEMTIKMVTACHGNCLCRRGGWSLPQNYR